MTESTTTKPAIVQMENITKDFFGVYALKGVDFELRAGEVHVLFGENGAGKSTLISILAGVIKPTSGEIKLYGLPVLFNSVHDSKKNGIETVFQEFSLIPTLTVAENIFLGDEPTKKWGIDRKKCKQDAISFFDALEFEIDINKKVSELSRAEQQMVEIVKAVKANAKVLILDEPTASLTDKEVAKLFDFIKKAKKNNVGIIYISHRIQEFREIADRITVLRDGELIATFQMDKISDKDLIESMTGRAIAEIYPKIKKIKEQRIIFSLKEYRVRDLEVVDFDVKSGEVLGIAGLVGSGKSKLWRGVMGLHPVDKGGAVLNGKDVYRKPTRTLLKEGMFYLPPDRKKEGLQLLAKTEQNININVLFRPDIFSKLGLINSVKQNIITKNASTQSDINPKYMLLSAASLSGGNQQKILFAKGLVKDYDIYVFDEPSVGVDVVAKAAIYLLIKELCESGKAVVIISSDLLEVINLSHRVMVFSKGKIAKELKDSEITESNILNSFF